MGEKRKIIIYISYLCPIGGAETWVYNFTSAFKDYFDITVMYLDADINQLNRLQVPHQRYNQYKGIFYCDILLYQFGNFPVNIIAKQYLHVIHFNYDQMPNKTYDVWGKIDGYIFPSEEAKKHFTGPLNDRSSIVLANPLATLEIPEKTKRNDNKLKILVASRMTQEKGGMRLLELSRQFNNIKKDYQIDIYSTTTEAGFYKSLGLTVRDPHLVFHKPKLDLRQEMVDSDYVAQLSDCESFCYTLHEAIILKVPVLVTDWDGVDKIVKDGKNGYIFNMGLTNVDIDKIFSHIPRIKSVNLETSNKQWIDYLNGLDLSIKGKCTRHFGVDGYMWNI